MKDPEFIPQRVEEIATQVVDAAYCVHKALGPGLLESVYETCLEYEFHKRNILVERQVDLPVTYEQIRLESGLRLDLVVDRSVIVEVKAIEAVLPVHKAQVLTYLKLTGHRLGFLINFNVPVIKQGIQRIAL